ncbi:MAG: NAD(P)-binding domain-containing protein [Leptospirillia bacterium]
MDSQLVIYAIPLLLIWMVYMIKRFSRHRQSHSVLSESLEAGLMEPASLHPVIDPNRCIGAAACVTACPEAKHNVLGVIRGKAVLVNPTACIGHGACREACPVDAIELVFGTAKRGVDIPLVQPDFQTNVPGIYIAGELGGMGLIRNAVEQGRQAMEFIAARSDTGQAGAGEVDVIIVGAGPAGFSASLGAMQHKLGYLTLEQDSLGGTVYNFPRGKLVMTAPVDLPLVGKVNFTETTKEELLAFWQKTERETGVKINYKEKVNQIEKTATGFTVTTDNGSYNGRTVLLTIGRRGTPRKLGVPGEEQPKVVYQLIDPEQFRGKHVLVVGGGDSALEAATSIADEEGTTVTISYRSEAFSRAKGKNRQKVADSEASGRLQLLMKSTVKEITPDRVILNQNDQEVDIPNDAVIVCAGGILPMGFLKETGIEVETKFGTR